MENMKWIKCREKLPEPHQDVLVFDGDYIFVDHRIDGQSLTWAEAYDVTHWMPLPEKPKRKE